MDESFVKAPLAVPKLSGFDKSHQNLLTSKVGTITPILVDELIPGSKVSCKLALGASLPPLASDTYMRCSIKCEAFFVPMRLLDGGFEAFFTDEPKDLLQTTTGSDGPELAQVSTTAYMPILKAPASGTAPDWTGDFGVGSLADYLGYRTGASAELSTVGLSALPFLAYHRIYNDWFRNSLIQKEVFLPISANAGVLPQGVAASSPYAFHGPLNYIWSDDVGVTLADGVRITELRQRNFGLDYFTTATPQPQQGSPMVVSFNTGAATGQFSIAALRAANSMQQFKERNNLLGNLYVEQLYGRYGVRPSDGIAQRSLYLGRGDFEVYSKGIYATQNGWNDDGSPIIPIELQSQPNPFGSVGARYGSAYASGESFMVDFEAKEPGYLFVMATLVPRVTYSTGIERYLRHYMGAGSLADMANPILQNVGPQPIYEYELTGSAGSPARIFGYTDRYADFKIKQDTLHGLFRDGETLDAFALQRSFAGNSLPSINSAFLQIPTDYMDQVTAVKQWISDYGYQLDTYFDYKVAMPISKYSLPTLQDPAYEHGRTIVVNRGGSKL